MQHQERNTQPIMKYWPMIIVVVGIIASYVTLQNQQASANNRLDKIEDKQATYDTTSTQLFVQLSAIQKDIEWIKLKLK